jgi:hypothetical protein
LKHFHNRFICTYEQKHRPFIYCYFYGPTHCAERELYALSMYRVGSI